MITATNGQRGAGFDLSQAQPGDHSRRFRSTGTTICGVVFGSGDNKGVVLASDTRATAGPIVADPQCIKLHVCAPNALCAGAGVAADTEQVTEMVNSQLQLQRLESRKQTRVRQVLTTCKRHLFQYGGHVGAYLVVGGVDVEGPFLGTVAAHGSTDRLPFVAMGSGSLGAMGVLESGYKDDLTLEEAKGLVTAAICSGIFNDPYSGTQVDVGVITKQTTEITYGHYQPSLTRPNPTTCRWSAHQTFSPNAAERFPQNPPVPERSAQALIPLPAGTVPIRREQILQFATIEEVPVGAD